MRARLRTRYGAGPLHLIGHVAMLAVAAFAFAQIFGGGDTLQLLEWFVGFALLHDLVLVPLYTGVDRLLAGRLGGARGRRRRAVPVINHVRSPALISGLLLLVYAPLISGVGDATYFFSSGHHVSGYLRNWVLISLCLFLISGVAYLVRIWRARRA